MVDKIHMVGRLDYTEKLSRFWMMQSSFAQIQADNSKTTKVIIYFELYIHNLKKSQKAIPEYVFICVILNITMLAWQPLLGPNFHLPPLLHFLCSRKFIFIS